MHRVGLRALLRSPWFFVAFTAACFGLGSAVLAAEKATLYRDEYGVPHIYSESAGAGLYASGWAQAEDRLEQMLKNFLHGMGEYSAAFGPGTNERDYRADLEALMWDHYGVAQRNYEELHPELQSQLAAFVDGINAYMTAHPGEVPEWWGPRPVDVYMPVAFSRQFIWGWPAGQAASDLRKIGLRPSYDVDVRASNEIAIAPSRSAVRAAILVIDPHLSWFGRQRYWEVRLHAGDIHISGFATAGFPYVNLGHNRHIAWAHTTGGPDTGDVYELSLDPQDPSRYRYDGAYRELVARRVEVRVRGEKKPRPVTFHYSHHGPIVARQGDKAYAAALAYADEIGYLESKYYFMIAEDYRGAIKALETRQIMPQNVMVADTQGNLYYQRTGRVPIRPPGYDFSGPVDGSTSRSEWRGLHPVEDLISILNPAQGYMQNCNITPDVMMVGSPMTPDRWPSYIFNQPARHTHQRASRAVEVLHRGDRFTVEEAIELALDKKCYQFERWLAELDRAYPRPAGESGPDGLQELLAWDGFARRDSSGALLYYYWRHALLELQGQEAVGTMIGKVNDYLEIFDGDTKAAEAAKEGRRLDDPELELLRQAFEKGISALRARHGEVGAVFGDLFRVGRLDGSDQVSWPVGGGSLRWEGMATLRAIGFEPPGVDGTRWGRSGQTSTQVVVLTQPIQSFTQPPIGQSDRPGSPHYRDQAEKLLSRSRMKPSWFAKKELLDGHVRSKIELVYAPVRAASP